ncbi:MAG: HpcH/HpaI aldolase family protein [Chlorobium sp.]
MEQCNGKSLKKALREKQLTIGSWITLAHPAIAEIMADAGFDWLTVDMEHSVITIREAEELIRVITLKGKTALVRLTGNDSSQIKRVMDAGAHGVIVPMVNSREQAEAAVRAVRYPPAGTRGVGLARAQKYGAGFEEYVEWLEDESVVIAQIEHIDAINNLESILAVDGIDGTIIGPYDLSASMGKPGKFEDSDVKASIAHYEEVSVKLQKPLGYHVIPSDYTQVSARIDKGYSFVAFSTDFLFLGNVCRDQLAKIKGIASQKEV